MTTSIYISALGSIGFVYVHHVYNWDQGTYSIVNTIFGFTQLIIVGISLPLLVRLFKISDPALGLIGVTSLMGKYTLLAFAQYKVFLYYLGKWTKIQKSMCKYLDQNTFINMFICILANIVGYLSILISLSIRSGISKLADKDELGKYEC